MPGKGKRTRGCQNLLLVDGELFIVMRKVVDVVEGSLGSVFLGVVDHSHEATLGNGRALDAVGGAAHAGEGKPAGKRQVLRLTRVFLIGFLLHFGLLSGPCYVSLLRV